MKPNVSERTVLQYVKLDFQGDWEYSADSFAFRPVGKVADLLVVREGATGIWRPIGSTSGAGPIRRTAGSSRPTASSSRARRTSSTSRSVAPSARTAT